MKVMQINCVYKQGSTGKIVFDIHRHLQNKGHESVVCYGRLDVSKDLHVFKTCGEFEARINRTLTRVTGLMYGSCFFSTNKLIKHITKEAPDIVHLQCINGFFVNIYRIITYLKKKKIRTVLTLHAEFMHTANCGYALDCERWKTGCGHCPRVKEETNSFLFDNTALSWKKMKKAFDGFETITIVSVSPWLQNRAQESPIMRKQRHLTILNGIDTTVFTIRSGLFLERDFDFSKHRVILHVSSNFSDEKDNIKGGYYVLEMAKRFLKTDPEVVFLVVGRHSEISDLPSNVILLGNIQDQKILAGYYSMADVTLITSKKETFSMVVAESLCCGTPVVGFEAGAPELITINEFSSFASQGDCDGLFREIQEFLYSRVWDKEKISSEAKLKYSKEVMAENYLKLYHEMMK